MRSFIVMLFAGAAIAAAAQDSVPVEQLGREREQAVVSAQVRAGQAYRDWQNAQFEAKLAEQDVLNLEEAYRRSSAETAEFKRQLDAAKKAFAAAQARAVERQKTYEQAVEAVGSARAPAPGK